MARFQADSLDLSRLPDPTLITVDYEADLAARLADLKARYAAIGIDYDETGLELDSGVILEEVDAERETIAKSAINDAGLSNMLAHAKGAALDQLGANLSIARLVLGTDNDGNPIMEPDAAFRRRIQLAPEAFATAGSAGAYVYHALSALGSIADASVQNPARGEVIVTVMGNLENPLPTTAQVDAVRERLFQEDIKPITDILTVQGADVLTVDLEADLILYRGPDATTVKADAETNLQAFLTVNKRLGRDLKLGAWIGRLYRDTVYGVVPKNPLADIIATPGQVVWVRSIKLNTIGVDE
jgi:phage-related baseplate assembly protein